MIRPDEIQATRGKIVLEITKRCRRPSSLPS
jgi:hypothetical protein